VIDEDADFEQTYLRISFENIVGSSKLSEKIRVNSTYVIETNIPIGSIIPIVICILMLSVFVVVYLKQ
jgi:hypothetical protein